MLQNITASLTALTTRFIGLEKSIEERTLRASEDAILRIPDAAQTCASQESCKVPIADTEETTVMELRTLQESLDVADDETEEKANITLPYCTVDTPGGCYRCNERPHDRTGEGRCQAHESTQRTRACADVAERHDR